MRVLFALESYLPRYGGEEVRVHNLATHLPSSWDVHIVAPRFGDCLAEERIGRVLVHRLGRFDSNSYFRNSDRPLFASLSYGMQLKRFFAENESFDLVQFGQWNMLHFWLAEGRLRCLKVVDWCEILSGELGGVKGIGETMLERALARRADHHTVTNDFAKLRLSNVHDVPLDEITVVENGVPEDMLIGGPPEKEAGLVLYVGRLAPHKQVDLLFEAVRLMREKGKRVTLHVVGEGPADYVRRLIAKADGTATFLGRLSNDQLKQEYAAAKVLVLPSRREGSSIVSLEAMSSWTPVITVDAKLNYSKYDVIRDGFNGLVVEDSAIGIANGLSRILDDEEAYQNLSTNAYETAKKRTWDRIASRLSFLFDSLINEKAAAGRSLQVAHLSPPVGS
jgi:glycosyltransferase involved in cell wall biosynthesis